ncbi:MAG: putative multidrug ABC transporter ATP-binding protein YbhF [Ignavibacteria bacterium]|nr:putative multidrug ABC transporter ATP-binding protein YbhF [Ignavibacteria bacterium]
MSAIEINNLSKNYGEISAVRNFSLNIKSNTMFGLVGPDGAGKTTLIRILAGLLDPDYGTVLISGRDIKKHPHIIKEKAGYLSQRFSLYTDLTVDENIEFISVIHGVKKFHKRRDELLEFTRLIKFRKFLAGQLSGGMKQKLSLACALIFKPELLLMDEPTTGVDPVSRREFWMILSELMKEKLTIIVSTPYMDEAERFNEIVMMNSGTIIAKGAPDEIKSLMNEMIIEIVCSPVRNAYKLLRENLENEIQLFGDRLHIEVRNNETLDARIKKLLEENSIAVSDFRKITPSLENAFIHLIRDKIE